MDINTAKPSTRSGNTKFFYGYIVVLAGFVFLVMQFAALYSFGVFFKPMAEEFGWTRALTSGAYSLALFIEAILLLVVGRLTDKFGPRVVMTVSGLLSGLGFLLMSQISTIWQLYLFLGVLVGIGRSGLFVPATSSVARWFTKRRGMMTGIVVSGIGIGTMIGPPVASQLIASYGWRTSYAVVGITALVLLVLAAQLMKRDPSKTGQLPYGESEVQSTHSVSGVEGFSFREATRTRQFYMLCALYFCLGLATQSIIVHIVPYATDLGISAIIAASIMTAIGLLSTTGRIVLCSIADRIGYKQTLVIGVIMLAVSLFWLTFARELRMLYVFAIIFGFGYGGEVALASPIVAKYFGLRAHGVILGAIWFPHVAASALGPLITGRIFDVTNSYYQAFVVCAALSVAALILASLLKPAGKKPPLAGGLKNRPAGADWY